MDHPIHRYWSCAQSCGAAVNGQLNKHVVNPWLASAISFALITFFAGASLIHPRPVPTQKDLADVGIFCVQVDRGKLTRRAPTLPMFENNALGSP
jgi:hypothetical protein